MKNSQNIYQRIFLLPARKYPCIPDFRKTLGNIHKPTIHKHFLIRFYPNREIALENRNLLDLFGRRKSSHTEHGCRLRLGLHPFRRVSLAFFLRSFLRLVSSFPDELCNLLGSRCHNREIPANWSKINTSTIFSFLHIPGRV